MTNAHYTDSTDLGIAAIRYMTGWGATMDIASRSEEACAAID